MQERYTDTNACLFSLIREGSFTGNMDLAFKSTTDRQNIVYSITYLLLAYARVESWVHDLLTEFLLSSL